MWGYDHMMTTSTYLTLTVKYQKQKFDFLEKSHFKRGKMREAETNIFETHREEAERQSQKKRSLLKRRQQEKKCLAAGREQEEDK
jgi:hypothetical protein